MTKLNVTQAAKALGMSKTTLYKHVDEGRVSCGLDDKSKKTFDPAELAIEDINDLFSQLRIKA